MSFNDNRSNPNASNYPNTGSTAANPRPPRPNPKDPNFPQEASGPVASDFLAAESLKSGGAFTQNEKVEAMGVEGAKSTLNNSDTPPGRRSCGRRRMPHTAGQVSRGSGEAALYGCLAVVNTRPAGPASDGWWEHAIPPAKLIAPNAAVGPAPTIYSDHRTEQHLKPKGRNIREGDIPPTETVMTNVGEAGDPERVAEQELLSRNADTSRGGAGGARQYGVERSTGEFDALSKEIPA